MENIRLVLEVSEPVRSSVSQVNVTINGRQFRMACEDGQEGHLQQLARELDERIVALRGQFGEIGDARLTVMAALMVADELAEAGKKLKRLEADLAALQDARGAAADRARRRRRRSSPPSTRRPSGSRAWPRSSARPAAARAAASRKARFTVPALRHGWQRPPHPHYIARAGLRGASESHSPGPYDPEGSCPWPGPWFRSYGAHLLM